MRRSAAKLATRRGGSTRAKPSGAKSFLFIMREPRTSTVFDPPLDHGIADAVNALVAAGVETFESCEGGHGHAYPVPTVRFHGDHAEGLRALAVAMRAQLPVIELRRVWPVLENEPTGPWWELTFRPTMAAAPLSS